MISPNSLIDFYVKDIFKLIIKISIKTIIITLAILISLGQFDIGPFKCKCKCTEELQSEK
jgi:hypothetical protein